MDQSDGQDTDQEAGQGNGSDTGQEISGWPGDGSISSPGNVSGS
jgi:hypothetical protein